VCPLERAAFVRPLSCHSLAAKSFTPLSLGCSGGSPKPERLRKGSGYVPWIVTRAATTSFGTTPRNISGAPVPGLSGSQPIKAALSLP
jgi:hypothetical protein